MANIGAAPPAAATGRPRMGRACAHVRTRRAARARPRRLPELGAIGVLTRRTIVAAVRPPYTYGPELASQFVFGLRMAWFPMVVASVAFTYGPGRRPGRGLPEPVRRDRPPRRAVRADRDARVRAAGLRDRHGRRRRHAICADLGARKIREELDALDGARRRPDQEPRRAALPRADGADRRCSNVFALLFGTLGGMLVTLANGAPLGPFFATFFTNATVPEIAASLIKTTIFGAIIAIVCCYKGLTVEGRPRGRRPRGQPGDRHLVHGDRRRQLRLHAGAAGDATPSCRRSDEGAGSTTAASAALLHGWAAPATSAADVVRGVFGRRVWPYLGEALRQAGRASSPARC